MAHQKLASYVLTCDVCRTEILERDGGEEAQGGRHRGMIKSGRNF